MKSKLMLCCALLISAVVASAIPWSADVYRHSRSLIRTGKLVEVRAYLDTIDEANQLSTFAHRIWADYIDPAIDTSTPAKLYAVAEGYYSALGSTGASLKNSSEYAVLWVYWANKEYDKALEYFGTLETPSVHCVKRAISALKLSGRVDEAIALAVANKQWKVAFNAANAMKDKVKTFEYGKELLLGASQNAKTVQQVLDVINDYNYKDTIITDEIKIDFYKEVDKKYRRFMATDPTTWKPILATVLHSLKALGVEVVE